MPVEMSSSTTLDHHGSSGTRALGRCRRQGRSCFGLGADRRSAPTRPGSGQRSLSARSDVTDDVLDAHTADFDQPAGEDPIIVDADDTSDPRRVRDVARLIKGTIRGTEER